MLSLAILSFIMLAVVMFSVVMPSVIVLSVIVLSVIMLSVIMLSVIILSVVAPQKCKNALSCIPYDNMDDVGTATFNRKTLSRMTLSITT